MKKLISLIALLGLFTYNTQAQTITTVNATAEGLNSIITNGARILSVTLTASSTNTAFVRFVDSYATNLTYTLSSYTNFITYATNIVSVYTTPAGVSQTNTNSGVYTVKQTVAASTNNYPTITTMSAGTNATVTWTPTTGNASGQMIMRGLTATNDNACTITVRYVNAY